MIKKASGFVAWFLALSLSLHSLVFLRALCALVVNLFRTAPAGALPHGYWRQFGSFGAAVFTAFANLAAAKVTLIVPFPMTIAS